MKEPGVEQSKTSMCRVKESGVEQSLCVGQMTEGPSGRKKVLGITGGVGAGKSTVLAYLRDRYGACVIQADEVGRILQTPGHDCYDQIVEMFGKEITDSQGSLRRDVLAANVFADPSGGESLYHKPNQRRTTYRYSSVYRGGGCAFAGGSL